MKSMFVGIGAAGNKALLAAVNMNVVEMKDCWFINSTSKDLDKDIPKENQIILSPTNTGCGKERGIAKQYVLTAIQSGKLDFGKEIDQVDTVVIVSSMEGGTGSGSAPMIGKYCEQVLGKNVHLFGFTGFEDDVRGLQNTIEFFQELDDEFMVHTIQNASFLQKANGNHFRAEELANEEFAKQIEILIGKNLIDSSQNIDDTDIYKVANTAGYQIIERIDVNGVMDREMFNNYCKRMITQSKSIKSKNPGQIRLGVILNLSEACEYGVDHSFDVLKKEYGNPFECFVQKQYDDGQEYIAFISSGMKLPIDEVKEIYKRYEERTSLVDKKEDDFFTQIAGLKGNKEDSRFNIGLERKGSTTSKADFMKQFQSNVKPVTPQKTAAPKATAAKK